MAASRHRGRELAVQMSYQWVLDPYALSDAKAIDRFWKEQSLSSEENREFFEALVRGVAGYIPKIDEKIQSALHAQWRLERLERIDHALLRVAVFEMLYYKGKDPADAAVVINEAVEIAKKFGTQQSPSFINGVLDKIGHEGKG
jgi:transcription antitermination protein NusB